MNNKNRNKIKNTNPKIKTSLEFRTSKETKGKRRFTFGLFILIGIVMLACVCTLLLLREYDFDIDNIIGRSPETTTEVSQTEIDLSHEGKINFLVAVSDEKGNHLHHTAIVSTDVATGQIKIYTVDTKENYDTDNFSGTLSSVLSKSDGSMLSLKDAVEQVTGVEISRYIRATDSSFKDLIKAFGGVPYELKERVEYSCDGVGYIIEKGNQTLTADMSYKYMYYLSQEETNNPEEMSNFLSAILGVALTQQNYDKADYLYNKLRNILDTDISAFDFSNNKAALLQVITLLDGNKATVVDSPDML